MDAVSVPVEPIGIPEYQYEPLITPDAVRVLVVDPAEGLEETLRCSIEQYTRTTELTSTDYCRRQHYSAISYTWGSALPSHELLIGRPSSPGTGGATSAYLKISANVDSLLRHLRKPHKAIRLWIDAVCLNQMDQEEKAQQILNMGDIYRAAKKVHIWLGDEHIDEARRAFSLMRQAGLRDEWIPSEDDMSLLSSLFARPWFTRRWIVQEAVLAHEARLHCGPDSLALSWALMALKKAQHRTAGLEALGYGPNMLLSSVAKYQEAPGRCSLLSFLWDLHLSECLDPRDRIAALYGLASSANRPPDIRYTLGTAQLYLDCAAYFANRDYMSANTLILHLIEFGPLCANSSYRDLPSWIPDWSRSRCPSLHSIAELQDILKPRSGAQSPEHKRWYLNPERPYRWPKRPRRMPFRQDCFQRYSETFISPTIMSAQANVLQIASDPLLFSIFGRKVQAVYCHQSSDWRAVLDLARRIRCESSSEQPMYPQVQPLGAFRSFFKDDIERLERVGSILTRQLGEQLAAFHSDMREKASLPEDLDELFSRCETADTPSEADIERLQRVGSILTRFSIIRTEETDFRDLASYLGPRDAAVGDILVPFIFSKRKDIPFSEDHYQLVSMCLKPMPRAGSEDKLKRLLPFSRTVRFGGLAFHIHHRWTEDALHSYHSYEEKEEKAFFDYEDAIDNGLQGPYIFDVI